MADQDETKVTKKIEAKATQEDLMLLKQYFEVHEPGVHKYTRAALIDKYRGVSKTPSEWKVELKGEL